MKIQFTMKTPDVISDIIDCELHYQSQDFKEKVEAKLNKWFEYGEYLHVEYDTDRDTMTVKKPQ